MHGEGTGDHRRYRTVTSDIDKFAIFMVACGLMGIVMTMAILVTLVSLSVR